MKVIMTGGGTGGHVNPAIAIADCIKDNDPSSEIIFVGTHRGIENKLVPRAGYELKHVEIRGLKRSLSIENIKTAYYVLTAPHKAARIIKDFCPDIVIGTGGYVCWPVLKAAQRMGIPTVLHESNAVPGVAVKMLEGKADRIFLNFDSAEAYLSHPEKAVHTGNPLRGEFLHISYEEAREKLGITGKYRRFILSCGGSMGAERVNDMALALMRGYTSHHPDVLHVHACGAIERELCTSQFKEMGLDSCENIKLLEYIYDMPLEMAAADIVICRAGAMTLSELAALGKPCVLIPSPHVAGNHQVINARTLERAGAAVVFEESGLGDGSDFVDAVKRLTEDEERLEVMSDAIASFHVPDAKKIIYKEISELVK